MALEFSIPVIIWLETIDIVVMTCCALYNFLRRKYSTIYTPNGSLDYGNNEDYVISTGLRTDNSNLIDIQIEHFRSINRDAKQIRGQFLSYFNNEGCVPWQNSICNL